MRASIIVLLLGLFPPQDPAPVERDIHGDPLPPGAVARLGRLRFGHYRDIYGNALSADGKTLATGGCDESIRIWDVLSGRLRRIIDTRRTFVIALTADGATMASHSSHDKCVRIHDTRTGLEIGKIDVEASTLSFSPDGTRLAVAGDREPLRVFDAAACAVSREWPEETKETTTAVFFYGGRKLASAGRDNTFRIWNAESGAELKKIDLERPAYKVVASPDSKVIALCSVHVREGPGAPDLDACAVILFDADSGKELRRLSGHVNMVLAMSFSSDGKTLVTVGKDTVIRHWDAHSGAELKRFEGHRDRISGVHFLPGNAQFVSTSDDHTIRLWDAGTGKELPVRADVTPRVWGLTWSPDGRRIATAGDDGTVRVWEPLTGKLMAHLKEQRGPVRAVAWSPDGRTIASASNDRSVKIYDADSGKAVREINVGDICATALSWSPDGQWLVGAGIGFVASWSASTGDRRFRIDLPDLRGRPTVAYSPDGKALGLTHEQKMWILDAAVGRTWISAHAYSIGGAVFLSDRTLAFLGESSYLVTVESERSWSHAGGPEGAEPLKLYRNPKTGDPPDLRDRGLRLWFQEHKKEFRYSDYAWNLMTIVASADGWFLAAGSADGSVRIFESFTGLEAKRLKWHYGNPDSLGFSPDGRYFASASNGETSALVWDLRAKAEYRAADFEKLWTELSGANAISAHQAVAALAAGGDDVVKEIRVKIMVAADPAVAAKALADLEHEELERREAAQTSLRKLGVRAIPAIRDFLEKSPSEEARRRLQDVLGALEGAVVTDPDAIRRMRVVLLLERMGTPAARGLLQSLSKDTPWLRERRAAIAAIRRTN